MATVNFYENIGSPSVQNDIAIEDWFGMIKGSEYSDLILRARGGVVNYDSTKEQLPCITYNFIFNRYKTNKNIVGSTGLMYIDVDDASFDISTVDKSKLFAYYRSFGGNGYAIIVKVEGITLGNFKPTYVSICDQLGILKYIDTSAVKATQFNVLSFDENIFINKDSYVFISEINESEDVTPSIVNRERRKAYTVDGVTKIRTQIRFNNLDEIQIRDSYVVNWDGYDFINCWIPMQKREKNQRNTFMLSYANNFIWLNQDITKEKAVEVMMNVNEVALVEPYPKWKIENIVESMFRYLDEGTLKPIYNHKKRKIVFNQQVKMSKEEKLDIVRNELAIMRTDKSIEKLIGIINNWDFKTFGKITVRKISQNHPISFKTVAKYYPQFKDAIDLMNFEWKNYQKVTTTVGATKNIEGVTESIEAGTNQAKAETESLEAQFPDLVSNLSVALLDASGVGGGGVLSLEHYINSYGDKLGREIYELENAA